MLSKMQDTRSSFIQESLNLYNRHQSPFDYVHAHVWLKILDTLQYCSIGGERASNRMLRSQRGFEVLHRSQYEVHIFHGGVRLTSIRKTRLARRLWCELLGGLHSEPDGRWGTRLLRYQCLRRGHRWHWRHGGHRWCALSKAGGLRLNRRREEAINTCSLRVQR
jgi:hypothetical protein